MARTTTISKTNEGKKRAKSRILPEKGLPQPTKALPVTLLSGFLGSGKTTLLQHILRSEHGLRIAVIVNDIGAINVDASLIRSTHRLTKTEEKVIALQNGCICCTLRGDLLEELVRLAELAEFDYIIVESSGISEPEQVAETFDSRLAEHISEIGDGPEGLDEATLAALKRLKEAGGLEKFAKLDTTCTVIDAFTMFHDFETADILSSRRNDVVPEDERTVSDLMVDQIEFADVIVLNKVDLVDDATRSRMRDLISKLNHRARVIESSYGKIEVKSIVNTGMFNLEVAQTGYGWLQDLHEMTLREVNGKKMVTPKPETEEYQVRNFVYVRRRPFHPRRLFDLLHDKFILQHELEDENGTDVAEDEVIDDWNAEEQEDEDSGSDVSMDEAPELPDNSTILTNKKMSPLFARLFRSKGEVWLATRSDRAGEWSQAGAMLTLQGGRPWFSTIDRCEWETGVKEIDELVENDIEGGGEYGDRRQELVFIGEKLDIQGIEAIFDSCLLSNEEWARFEAIMHEGDGPNTKDPSLQAARCEALNALFEDGFPDWPATDDGHESMNHDHATSSNQHNHQATSDIKVAKHTITKDGIVEMCLGP